ncbi:hypothetical protein FRC08_015701, partial [Ceratobasidium sp. 394]
MTGEYLLSSAREGAAHVEHRCKGSWNPGITNQSLGTPVSVCPHKPVSPAVAHCSRAMARLSFVRCVYALAALSTYAHGQVTVYKVGDQKGSQVTATTSAGAAAYTGSAAYDPTVLNPPSPPDQLNRDYTIQ